MGLILCFSRQAFDLDRLPFTLGGAGDSEVKAKFSDAQLISCLEAILEVGEESLKSLPTTGAQPGPRLRARRPNHSARTPGWDPATVRGTLGARASPGWV